MPDLAALAAPGPPRGGDRQGPVGRPLAGRDRRGGARLLLRDGRRGALPALRSRPAAGGGRRPRLRGAGGAADREPRAALPLQAPADADRPPLGERGQSGPGDSEGLIWISDDTPPGGLSGAGREGEQPTAG